MELKSNDSCPHVKVRRKGNKVRESEPVSQGLPESCQGVNAEDSGTRETSYQGEEDPWMRNSLEFEPQGGWMRCGHGGENTGIALGILRGGLVVVRNENSSGAGDWRIIGGGGGSGSAPGNVTRKEDLDSDGLTTWAAGTVRPIVAVGGHWLALQLLNRGVEQALKCPNSPVDFPSSRCACPGPQVEAQSSFFQAVRGGTGHVPPPLHLQTLHVRLSLTQRSILTSSV